MLRFRGGISKLLSIYNKRFLSESRAAYAESIAQVVSSKEVNRSIEIKGWVKALRRHKDVVFLDVADGSSASKIQVVVPAANAGPELSYGCSVKVTGHVVPSKAKGQELELQAEDVVVLGACDVEEYPFRPRKSYPIEYVRQHFHLRPRLSKYAALLRIRNAAAMAIHSTFQEAGFYHVHTPVITSNDCEGGGEVFVVTPLKSTEPPSTSAGETTSSRKAHFFGTQAFLTVSAQLHLEALAMSLSKVYTFAPTFRAENCNTRRHLCEFHMVEAEQAFVDTLDTLLDLTEKLVKSTFCTVIDSCADDLHSVCRETDPGYVEMIAGVLEKPFLRLTYDECVRILASGNDPGLLRPLKWGEDLTTEHEQRILSHCGDHPVFVTHFPASTKPFYMKRDPTERTVEGFDLLLPYGGEACGGSLREDAYDVLRSRMEQLGMAEKFEWYLDLRKYGSVPHGGFGLGFDRVLQYFTATRNIKDIVPFPRWANHCQA